MTVILAPTSGAPSGPPPRALRTAMQHTWTGWDGTEWELTGKVNGTGVYLRPGVRGTNAPEFAPYLTQLAGVDGDLYRGHRVNSREVFWPLSLWHGGDSQEWFDYDSAFWRTLDPERQGVWRVQQPNGAARSLRLRFAGDGGHALEWDPGVFGWERYGVYFRADQPLWEGDPITRSWAPQETQPFFGGAGGGGLGPPFFISSGSTLANAALDNPGDVEAWPVWTIDGPTDEVSVGIGGRVVEVDFPIIEGSSLVIDTRPTEQTAWLDGVDVTNLLGDASFAAIPAGQALPLSLAMVGAGVVRVDLTPLYRRAW